LPISPLGNPKGGQGMGIHAPFFVSMRVQGAVASSPILTPQGRATMEDSLEAKQNRLALALEPSDHNGNPFMVLTNHRGQQQWWHAS
jgi:hypothetical protein